MKSVGKIIVGTLTGVGLLAIVGSALHLLVANNNKYLEKEDIDKVEGECSEGSPEE